MDSKHWDDVKCKKYGFPCRVYTLFALNGGHLGYIMQVTRPLGTSQQSRFIISMFTTAPAWRPGLLYRSDCQGGRRQPAHTMQIPNTYFRQQPANQRRGSHCLQNNLTHVSRSFIFHFEIVALSVCASSILSNFLAVCFS